MPLPRQPAPELAVRLIDGKGWRLSQQAPKSFTMIVFYRGLHCPVCEAYLKELHALQDAFARRGVEVVAVSMDSEKRARWAVAEWEIEGLPLGYGLDAEQARRWGLYLSRGLSDDEPDLFTEPALFLVQPDGVLYYAAVTSMPFGQPKLPEVLEAVDAVLAHASPARGEVDGQPAATQGIRR